MSFLKEIEFRIKDSFFFLFQLLLKKGRGREFKLDGTKLNRIILLRPDRIGDTVCSFPLIDSLLKSFPQMKISIFASSKNYPLIKHDPRFDKIFIYRRNILKDIAEVRKIRREKYQAVVDLLADDSVTTLFLSQFCSAGSARIGLGKKKYAKYYDYNYTPEPDCRDHTVDINLKLMDAFGDHYKIADCHAAPFVDSASNKKVDTFLESITGGENNCLLIGFNLSARGENRNWGFEKSKELINKLLDRYSDSRIILITAPAERARADRLDSEFDKRVTQIFPNANLTEASALISRLDLLISPDTSLVHIARSLRIPVVGLYAAYKNVYYQWQPFHQEKGLVLSYGGDDIFTITVDQVFETVGILLKETRPVNK